MKLTENKKYLEYNKLILQCSMGNFVLEKIASLNLCISPVDLGINVVKDL